jgi:hypothetical protein
MLTTAAPSAQLQKSSLNASSPGSPNARKNEPRATDLPIHFLQIYPVIPCVLRVKDFVTLSRVLFLHFLCTPCAQSSTPPSEFVLLTLPANQTPHSKRLCGPFHKLPDPCSSIKIQTNIFLNCTKNTELTKRPFARTFILAPRQKNDRDAGPHGVRSLRRGHQPLPLIQN